MYFWSRKIALGKRTDGMWQMARQRSSVSVN